MIILFKPDNIEYQAQEGENLLKASEKAGVLIDASCAGAGTCGKCKVKVVSGNAGKPDEAEANLLSGNQIQEGFRLACKVLLMDDLVVEVPGSHRGSTRKKKMAKLPEDFIPDPGFKKIHIKVDKPSMKNQMNDFSRIAQAIDKSDLKIHNLLLPKIHGILDSKKGDVTAILNGNILIGLEAGDTEKDCYGVSFDIGTTTVVGMLWNLNTNKMVDVEAATNPQSVYGSDVISRIQFCNEDEENLKVMQSKIIECFNDILHEIFIRNSLNPEYVYGVTVVGNTTMSHLFLGVHPGPLARTPFSPVFCIPVDTGAKILGINVNECANVHLLPNIAGHVGSDIVGVILATGIDKLKGSSIAIDIGTNGEVVAAMNGKLATCSTAAGPAFEGACIHHGMRAAKGAIEGVRITKDTVELKIIDAGEPIGICGSGLIDAVAQMLDAGLIEQNGRLIESEEAFAKGIPDSISARLFKTDTGNQFILAYGENGEHIVLTQQDIREVQLAKGAIHAGIKTLMRFLGMELQDIDRIILAGAFGNYIKKESALRIGLLPNIPAEKIISSGNAAGAGACMALLSNKSRSHAVELAKAVEHVELSMNLEFQEEYMNAMSF